MGRIPGLKRTRKAFAENVVPKNVVPKHRKQRISVRFASNLSERPEAFQHILVNIFALNVEIAIQ